MRMFKGKLRVSLVSYLPVRVRTRCASMKPLTHIISNSRKGDTRSLDYSSHGLLRMGEWIYGRGPCCDVCIVRVKVGSIRMPSSIEMIMRIAP